MNKNLSSKLMGIFIELQKALSDAADGEHITCTLFIHATKGTEMLCNIEPNTDVLAVKNYITLYDKFHKKGGEL